MGILCLSASNIKSSGENSTSLRLAKIIEQKCRGLEPQARVTVVDLRGFEFTPCIGCGDCAQREYQCRFDDDYSALAGEIVNTDALFIVSPHYAPIPSKLSMLLEKLEQNAFLKRFNNANYRCPLFDKPLGIIGHGGGTADPADWYRRVIIDSISNALSYPIEMRRIDYDEYNKAGIIISPVSIQKSEDSIFPIQEYDWNSIVDILGTYAAKVMEACGPSGAV